MALNHLPAWRRLTFEELFFAGEQAGNGADNADGVRVASAE